MRGGREPAEDLKRRIVAACQQAGLVVQRAKFYLSQDGQYRVVQASAHTKSGSSQKSMIGIMGILPINGEWSGTVEIRCAAVEDDADLKSWDAPIMQGRDAVSLHELVEQLKTTVEEREQVLAALKLGVAGPYTFGDVWWETPSDFMKF